jgi:hypothetical protein
MQKTILFIITLLLITLTGINAQAQNTEKKEAEKPQTTTTTVDAWREATPLSEQSYYTPPAVVEAESSDNVESKETDAQIEKRILDLEQRLMEALKKRDPVMLKHLLAEDFVPAGVNITAAQPDKTRYIEWALKNLELKSYTLGKTTVRVFRTTAIVTVNYKRQATIAGLPSNGDFIITDVWVKREKQWKAVSHHISQSSKP